VERRGADAFTGSRAEPVPRPVGHVLPLAMTSGSADDGDDGRELSVIRHGQSGDKTAYFSVVAEIEGRGGGLRHEGVAAREDRQVRNLLMALASEGMPVDQLTMHVRALPGLSADYQAAVGEMIDPRLDGTPLGTNMRQKLRNLEVTSDLYRSYAVIGLPERQVSRWAQRHGRGVAREAITQTVYDVSHRVADQMNRAGFAVAGLLGPAEHGALIRHLYCPSWGIDDVRGIDSVLDGFQPYPQPPRELLSVPDWVHDVGWFHATADIPPWGWPVTPIQSRWLEPIVTGLFNRETKRSIPRTVTTSWRLLGRQAARKYAHDQVFEARKERIKNRGRVTTGEDEEQDQAGTDLQTDLSRQAAGVEVAVRLTVSARRRDALLDARDLAEENLTGAGVTKLRWREGRQDAAMVLNLPLGRGW
jgi:hypothetical protein